MDSHFGTYSCSTMKHARHWYIIAIWFSGALSVIYRDICNVGLPSHIYLINGEQGTITQDHLFFRKAVVRQNHINLDECKIQIVTCSSCIITLKLKGFIEEKNFNFKECKSSYSCLIKDHVQLLEHKKILNNYIYNNSSEEVHFFKTETRYLTISFNNYRVFNYTFKIEYSAERNIQYFQGVPDPDGNNITFGGTIKSPYFPSFFPRDIGIEYAINCKSRDVFCRVKLLFTDFLVSEDSIFQFYEWTGRKIRISYGFMPRPPVILSNGPSMLIRFFANGATGLGFKANYYFVTGEPGESELIPFTDCGGEIENVGGGITMLNMAEGTEEKNVDCIWLIKPYNNFLSNKLNLFLKIITFKAFPNADLKIYEGQTSEGNLVEGISSTALETEFNEHVVTGTAGFYITLQGKFNSSSQLAISYSTFSFKVCYTGPEFLCQNKRCINRQMYCDGLDHCGDNSDEPAVCSDDWHIEPIDRTWYTHIANYYFPRGDRYIDFKAATLIFTLSSIGLVFLIGGLVILLYRMGIRARHQRERQQRLQSISDLFGDGEEVEVEVQDDPPLYEPPPSYDDVTKEKRKRLSKIYEQYKCFEANQRYKDTNKKTPPDSPPPPYTSDISSKSVAESTAEGNASGFTQSRSNWTAFPQDEPIPSCSTVPDSKGHSLANSVKQLYDFHLLWNLVPRKVNKRAKTTSNLAQQCNCEGACSCASSAPKSMEKNSGKIAGTWSPATTKLEAIDLILSQLQNKFQNRNFSNENKNKKRQFNLKGSASADNLFVLE